MRRVALLVVSSLPTACGSAPEPADVDAGPPPARPYPEYHSLSETGLYEDIGTRSLAADLLEFGVNHVLWSDGAAKRRWLRLPPKTTIDTSDMDHWRLPPGAQLFKEFSRDGVTLETRLIEKVADTGKREDDFWVGAFRWLEDGSDAVFVEEGEKNVLGTDHDVPSAKDCWTCHKGQPGSVLGVGALQLAQADGATDLSMLEERGLLSETPERLDFRPPGDETTSKALGYLHANCAHCHNPRGTARIDTDMDLELFVTDVEPESTRAYQTTLGVELQYWTETQDEFTYRAVPGDPDASAMLFRMQQRGDTAEMPPLATKHVDEEGVAIVRAWIAGL